MYTLKLIDIHCSTASYSYHTTPLLLYWCPYNCLYIKLSNWKWITIIILNDNWTVAWNGSPGLMPPEQLNAVHWSGLSQNLSVLSDFTTFKLFHLFLTYFQRYETWEDPCLDWRELPNCHWHRRPRQEDLEFYILIQHSTLLSPLRSCPKSKVQYHSCWNRIIFETQAKLLSHCLKNIEFYEIPSRVATQSVTNDLRMWQ